MELVKVKLDCLVRLPCALRLHGKNRSSQMNLLRNLLFLGRLAVVLPGWKFDLLLLNLFTGCAFRQSEEGEEFFLHANCRIEFVQPQELTLFVDLQKPPATVLVNREVETSKLDPGFLRKCQHRSLDIAWGGNFFNRDVTLPNLLAPIERSVRCM